MTSLLTQPTYFRSPIATISSSIDRTSDAITLYDLIDAYNTFSRRIATVSASLLQDYVCYPALKILEENADILAHCIQRDIRRGFTDPLATSLTASISSAPPTAAGISQNALGSSRDIFTLCRYALQLLSNIFRFPVLHALFSQVAMTQLLEDTLVIAKSPEPPLPDGAGICTVALWIFSTIQLPAATVASSQHRIQEWVNDLPSLISSQPRACDILHHLLSQYPDIFLHRSTRLLPDVLSELVSVDPNMRMKSAVALAGFALARLSVQSDTLEAAASQALAAVYKFTRRQLSKNRTGPSQHLPDYIARAARGDLTSSDAQGPRWAICVICCLTILSGEGIYTGTRSLKLLLDTVEHIARSKQETAIDLVACVWRCLIWAFLQIPSTDTDGELTSGALPEHEQPSKKEVVFHIVKQELRGGAGACLVAGLLNQPPYPGARLAHTALHLCWALMTLKDLVSHASQDVYRDGLALLGQLTSGIGASADASTTSAGRKAWEPNDLLAKVFLSRYTLTSDAETFASVLRDGSRFDATLVRPLNEPEVVAHWDELVAAWTIAAERELVAATESFRFSDVLIQTWQALLLTQTQLTQERGHLTATPEFTAKAVTTVTYLLEWRPSSATEPNSHASIEAQRRALKVCAQLWAVMRHVFSDSWLSAAAGSILSSTIQHRFNLSDERVKAAWGELCADLVSYSASVLMARLAAEDEDHCLVDIKRELWCIAARQWPSIEPSPSWRNTIEFLAIPFMYWTMDDTEATGWIDILDHALTQAGRDSDTPLSVFDLLATRIAREACRTKLLEMPTILVALLSRLQLSHANRNPAPFLQLLNDCLCDLYSDLPEHVSAALQLHQPLRRLVNECSVDALVELLTVLSPGLSTWIADDRQLLLVEEYNNVVIPIYCDALRRLHDILITPDILAALAHVLFSAFVRVPKPGHGPVAFSEFWAHVHPSLKGTRAAYPDEIKMALYACRDVFGSSHLEDLSFDTESHSGSQAEVSPVKAESLTPKSTRPRGLGMQTPPAWNTSPAIPSPEIPYDPPACSQSQDLPSSSPLRPVNLDFVSSDYMPSSPTIAARTRRLAPRPPVSRVAHERPANPADRPMKKRKVEASPRDTTAAESSRAYQTISPRPPSVHSASPVAQPRKPNTRRTSARRTTPQSDRSKGKRVASSAASSSPAKGSHALSPSSDDYDAWEAPICDFQDLSGTVHQDVPDSQTSGLAEDDDSLLPSFMKADRGHDEPHEHGHARSDDTMIIDSDGMPDIPGLPGLNKRARPASPIRTHTAPAELEPSHSHPHSRPDTGSPPPVRARLGRAQTASAQLEELRNVYDALREEGSQLGVGEIAAASALTSRLGALLSEKLSRRLAGAREGGDGSEPQGGSESQGGALSRRKGKGKGRK
ncbi:hypothetical protein C2E23DRAFT_732427 [Lenzites betulinus]|nr:hypothetical protein C2E23DRAFT_732427 [Lenzites betulinus]